MFKKNPVFSLLIVLFFCASFSGKEDVQALLGKKMPTIPNGKTIDGQVVDTNYFNGHLTLVSFMYIGCPPCMNEIGMLNRLNAEMKEDSRFQMLCIARQQERQMVAYNKVEKDTNSVFSLLKAALGAPSIEYSILAACKNAPSSTDTITENMSIGSECDVIKEYYGITAFPTMFLVGRDGNIIKIDRGGPATKTDTVFYSDLKRKVLEELKKL